MSSGSKAFPVGRREEEGGARGEREVGGDIPRDALGKTEHTYTHTGANDRGRETKKERGEDKKRRWKSVNEGEGRRGWTRFNGALEFFRFFLEGGGE